MSAPPREPVIATPLTRRLGIKHPVLLAGMATVSNAELAAAVTNAGGIGTIGGVTLTPAALRKEIAELKSMLVEKDAPFGVDLLLPRVGEGARKTNYDYTGGRLDEIVDEVIAARAKLFVSAVGVPPAQVVERLESAGVVTASLVGAPHHVDSVVEAGVSIVIAQGYEAGGHTGEIGTLVLVRQCVERARGKRSKRGQPISVVAAGGIGDGRGLAAALALGAEGVWVGTRFICAAESGATKQWQENVIRARALDTMRTEVVTGRPLRLLRTPYYAEWEKRPADVRRLCDQGVIPLKHDRKEREARGERLSPVETKPYFMGQIAGSVTRVMPAKDIVEEIVRDAVAALGEASGYVQQRGAARM